MLTRGGVKNPENFSDVICTCPLATQSRYEYPTHKISEVDLYSIPLHVLAEKMRGRESSESLERLLSKLVNQN